jgi:phosphoribosylanthranilate isomerase
MSPEIKFCGLTRPADACEAAALGAAYLGVIFAPSPRRQSLEDAAAVFAAVDKQAEATSRLRAGVGGRATAAGGAGRGATASTAHHRPQRVGVFAAMELSRIAAMARSLSLDVIQLHDTGALSRFDALRESTGCRIWSVIHVGDEGIVEAQLAAAAPADAVLLDAKVDGLLGGTGRSFDWERVHAQLAPLRALRPVILAGGLRPENVARAIESFSPDIVDVSSGVERTPGIKDPARMRAFADAVHGVSQA